MVALRNQGNWRWEGPLGTPLGLVHWKRASSPVEAGTSGLAHHTLITWLSCTDHVTLEALITWLIVH